MLTPSERPKDIVREVRDQSKQRERTRSEGDELRASGVAIYVTL